MRIAILGPSGSGKTTLAKFIAKEYNLPYITSKETRQVPEEVAERWDKEYDYRYSDNIGHQALIQLQNKIPGFGLDWQKEMLNARDRAFSTHPQFVCDRSPVDNLAYMFAQVSHNASEPYIEAFIKQVQTMVGSLTHLIWIRTNDDQPSVEANNSRVANLFYQKHIDGVFETCLHKFLEELGSIQGIEIDFWGITKREKHIKAHLVPTNK